MWQQRGNNTPGTGTSTSPAPSGLAEVLQMPHSVARSPEGCLGLLQPLLLPSVFCSSLKASGGLRGAGDSRDTAEQSGWQGPRGVPASSVLGEDEAKQELCFPHKRQRSRSPRFLSWSIIWDSRQVCGLGV